MADYVIVPSGVANSYRKRYGDWWALDPIKLEGRNAYALPVAVLVHAAFIGAKPSLDLFDQETLTVEDFAWWHVVNALGARA